MTFDRRSFVRMSLGAAGTLCFPVLARAVSAGARVAPEDPHFFFQIVFPGGMDPSYLFDARPLAMTQAGLIQNYLGEEPTEWLGCNGGKAWATRLVNPLKPYRDRFSVINGVVMATGFDGHDQNMNFMMSGDPFGGESFVPHLNRYAKEGVPTSLDAVTAGYLPANITNNGSVVPLSADSAAKLLNRLKKAAPLSSAHPLYSFILGRMAINGQGAGTFSQGAQAMKNAFEQAPAFASMFSSLQLDSNTATAPGAVDPRYLQLCMQLFKQGITRSAVFAPSGSYDAHDVQTARSQPASIGAAMESLASIYKMLAETPFDDTRSFLDVTTVMACSEFGRTLRQKDLPIGATGTDHNPLNNSILLGGKGIRGGQVIGESDLRLPSEKPSKAHAAFDPTALKMMGRPFDFGASRARVDLPDLYRPTDYLGMASVVNTLYSLFGVSKDRNRKLMRNGANAPTVSGLLLS